MTSTVDSRALRTALAAAVRRARVVTHDYNHRTGHLSTSEVTTSAGHKSAALQDLVLEMVTDLASALVDIDPDWYADDHTYTRAREAFDREVANLCDDIIDAIEEPAGAIHDIVGRIITGLDTLRSRYHG